MNPPIKVLRHRMADALARLGINDDPMVRAAQDAQFGDYQSNCAMSVARKLGKKPGDVAKEIKAQLEWRDITLEPEIKGPGFINFRLSPAYLARAIDAMPAAGAPDADRLGIARAAAPQTAVVDLSSPNLAKEMHVGHLRSTVIGDCVARLLEFAGHHVIRENHVGDWGTQFGMLLAHLRRVHPEVDTQPDALAIADLEAFYVEAKSQFDSDEGFKKESRDTVVALQQGDPAARRIWKAFCDESLRHCHEIYRRLGVTLIDRGESFYNDLMEEVLARLERMRAADPHGAVRESEGALCVFLDGFQTRDGEPLPLIVRKSDGGYNYATSDLATILHRVEQLGATRIVYVVGIAQKQHFEMLFAAARKLGWAGPHVTLEHLGFGNMLSAGGRPFKTREGGTVKLKDLLGEAVARAQRVIDESKGIDEVAAGRDFTADQAQRIAETVGLAAVKYFDLSHGLSSDYKFDLDTMLSLDGNTAPYMLYAYARVRSIGRKAGVDFERWSAATKTVLEHQAEVALATKLLQFAETLEAVTTELKPNMLTDYLFELSKVFSRFYDKKLGVRVIDASPEDVRNSRLRLCDLTARTLRLGLNLLGINTLEQM